MPLARILTLLFTAQMALFGYVERIVDGDTIKVRLGSDLETVRYIGVDTPETVHPTRGVEPYGKAASRFNASLVEGKRVRLEVDVERRDRYGRLLAYVYVDSLFVNAELLRQGYAQLMTVPPNVRHVEEFVLLQREARPAGAGLWGLVSTGVDAAGVPAPGAAAGDTTAAVSGSVASAAGEELPPTTTEIIVYVTKSGAKYHRAGCRYLKGGAIAMPLAVAREAYEPCRICQPPPGGPHR